MMIQPIPRYFLKQLDRYDRKIGVLEAAVYSAISAGNLKPGDQISSPEHLAEKLKLSPVEVLESISAMLSSRILRQNENGDLFINAAASRPIPSRNRRQVA